MLITMLWCIRNFNISALYKTDCLIELNCCPRLKVECVQRLLSSCPVRYEYDGNDVYQLLVEEEDYGRVVALLIWVRDLLT